MSTLSYRVQGGIARIGLSRAPVNAITPALLHDLLGAIETAARDDDVQALLLASDLPGRFCAGLDLPDLLMRSNAEVRSLLDDLYIRLHDVQHRLDKPSIAVVNGTARGGGVTLAISCDVILAASDATFGYPEIDLGLPPAIHFAHLPRIVGRHRAFELLFSGRSFSAGEAAELGLVSRVAEPAMLEAAASDLAALFAAKPRPGVVMARAAFMRQNDFDYRRSVAAAVIDFCHAFETGDARDRLAAFVTAKAEARARRHPPD